MVYKVLLRKSSLYGSDGTLCFGRLPTPNKCANCEASGRASHTVDKNSVSAVISDNAVNMVKAKYMLRTSYGWEGQACTVHTPQLCLKSSLQQEAISGTLGKARKLVAHFKRLELCTTAREKQMKMNEANERATSTRNNGCSNKVEQHICYCPTTCCT